MEFIKRISRLLLFTAGPKRPRAARGPRRLAACLSFAAAAAALSLAQSSGLPWARRAQAARPEALRGAAAVERLKADGGYASLAEAMRAARGRVGGAGLSIDPILTQQQKLAAADAAALDQFGAAVALSGDTAVVAAPLDDQKGVSNQGSVYVFTRSGAVWTLQQKLTASDGAANDGFGSSVALSGDTLAVGVYVDDVGANADQGSAYVFTRSGGVWTQQQKLTAADGMASQHFGFSIALGGDTLVVGAQGDDVGANANQGSAYVFTRGNGAWTLQQKLLAKDGATGDNFGFSVAISGDTVVVGAENDDIGRSVNQGSAYVFTRGAGVWTQLQRLNASDGAAGDQFGSSVAVSGDTAVVGAMFDDVGLNSDQGSAYVFTRSLTPGGEVWTQQQKLTADDGAAKDQFGVSAALSGDTVIVGASLDAVGSNAAQGSAYVFTRAAAAQPVWTQRQKLVAGDGANNDQFGRSVALNGGAALVGAPNSGGAFSGQGAAYVFVTCDESRVQQQQLTANDGAAQDNFGGAVAINGDTIAVGAERDTVGPNASQGAVYVFTRSGATWSLQQKLTSNDGAENSFFGSAVSLNGDTLLVGASLDPIEGRLGQGSAYVFTRSGGVWTQRQKLVGVDREEGQEFGFAVALGDNTLAVGAFADGNGPNRHRGAVYVFTQSGGIWAPQQKIRGVQVDEFFGNSIALSGDTLAVGAFRDDVGANVDQGSAYIYTRNNGFWTQQQKLTAPDGAVNDFFGFSVALSGDTVAVGSYQDDVGTTFNQGSAYVFTRSGGVWTQQQKLTANDGVGGDEFGYSVALSGDTLVVGADVGKVGANGSQGSAYVFTRDGGAWTQRQKLIAADGAAVDLFGSSVALGGGTIVVGAPFDDIGANENQGSAYVFVGNACQAAALKPAEERSVK
jgi:hypothetical protein